MNGDPDRKTWVERPNQPPKPECCRTEGQAQAPAEGTESRTTVWKRTQGDSQAASGSRTPLKQSSLETTLKHAGGDAVASSEPNTEETERVRFPETCRGRRAWHASTAPCGNWEALPPPEAPTAGAKRDRRFNDKKTSPQVSKSRESDRSIVVRGQASAAPTRSKGPAERRNPQRKPAPEERRNQAGEPPCGP